MGIHHPDYSHKLVSKEKCPETEGGPYFNLHNLWTAVCRGVWAPRCRCPLGLKVNNGLVD